MISELVDPWKHYDSSRDQCPVSKDEFGNWWALDHKTVKKIILDHQTFSNSVSNHLSVPNGMDPPSHTRYRSLIEPYFSETTLSRFEDSFRSIARGLIKRALNEDVPDIIESVALPFAGKVQCAFLGWPDSISETLIRWVLDNQQAVAERNREKLTALANEFEGLVEKILENQKSSLKSQQSLTLTQSLLNEKVDGEKLTIKVLTSILRNWTAGEVGTIAASIGNIMYFLAHHRDVQKELRSHPEIIESATDEILRIHGPLISNRRKTTRSVTLNGKNLKKDEIIFLNWISANRDDQVFENPCHYRQNRDSNQNLLYGKGIHDCPGAPLARMEFKIFLEEMFRQTKSIRPAPNFEKQFARYPASGYSYLPLVFL